MPDKLIPVQVKITSSRHIDVAVRRELDARIWGGLDHAQQDAACRIADANRAINSSVYAKTMRFDVVSGGQANHDFIAIIQDQYGKWKDACRGYHINADAILNILVEGWNYRRVARHYRRGNSWPRENLHEGLDLFCYQQGWKPSP